MNNKTDNCSNTLLTRVAVLEERAVASKHIAEERDRFYLEKFKASEVAVGAAITAQREQTASSFASSEKAIVKAEEAQREYNVRSNEFRDQLDDQAKTLMPRQESDVKFAAIESKLEDLKRSIELVKVAHQTVAQQSDVVTLRSEVMKQISELREYRSSTTGKGEGMHLVITFLVGLIGPAIAVVVILLKK